MLGFGPERIRTLVFMGTDSSHRLCHGLASHDIKPEHIMVYHA